MTSTTAPARQRHCDRCRPKPFFGGPLTLLDPATPKPMKDGRIVRECVDVAFAAGRQARIPYFLDGNSFESSLFVAAIKANPAGAIARSGIDPARAIVLFGQGDKLRAAINLTTVALITEPDRFLADSAVAAGMPVYRYYFFYVPAAERGIVSGAFHGAEVPTCLPRIPCWRQSSAVASSPLRRRGPCGSGLNANLLD